MKPIGNINNTTTEESPVVALSATTMTTIMDPTVTITPKKVEEQQQVGSFDPTPIMKELTEIKTKLAAHIENASVHPNKTKRDEWDAKETVKGAKSKADAVQARLNAHTAEVASHVSKQEKLKYSDKYTRAEVDNKIAASNMHINWQDAVDTFEQFQTKYVKSKYQPKEGDFVAINKESRAFRYSNGNWREVGFNIYPLATAQHGGLMSAADKTKLDQIEDQANNYVHPTTEHHVSLEQISEWDKKADKNIADYYTPGLMSPEMVKKLNAIVFDPDIPVTVARDVKVPIVKDTTNTITIGPTGSPADFIVSENHPLDQVFASVFKNLNIATIKILKGEYFVTAPIVVKTTNIAIVGEPGVTITNKIKILDDKKANQGPTFDMTNSCDVSISNINFMCDAPIAKQRPYIYGKMVARLTVFDCCFNFGNGVHINGFDNTVKDSIFIGAKCGVFIRSTADCLCTRNRITGNRFDVCDKCIVLGTYKTPVLHNVITDNIITNSNVGIDLCNDSVSYTVFPEKNIVKDNNISRDSGYTTTGQYTIRVNGYNNVITDNLLEGRDVISVDASKKNFIRNYVVK